MIKYLRRVMTGVVITTRIMLSNEQLFEVVSTMVLLLTLVVELLQMWLNSQKAKKDESRDSPVRG